MKCFTKYIGRLWTREKPDGKNGWGALRYLVVGVSVCALGLWAIARMQGNSSASRAAAFTGSDQRVVNPAAKDVQLGEVAKAAQRTQPVNLQGKEETTLARSEVGMALNGGSQNRASGSRGPNLPGGSDSFFGNSRPSSAPSASAASSSNDSIFAALNSAEAGSHSDGRPPLNEEGAAPALVPAQRSGRGALARSGFGNPTVDGNDPRAQRPNVPPIESLVVTDSHVSKMDEEPPQKDQTPARPAGPTHFLPRGEIIPVYIMQTVETGRFPTLIEFAVAKTVWFNGKPVLPFGTRFMATAGVGVRDRITFNVDSVRRRDGLEIALAGMVLGEDKATGMRSYFVPPPTMAQIAPYVGDFAQAFADIAKANLSNVALHVGSVSVQTQPSMGQQTREIAAASASQALSAFMQGQLADIRDRYAAYSTVLAGSKAYIQLTANTDFSALWDGTPRGALRTVGTPVVVETDTVYRLRATEQQQDQAFASMLAQGGVAVPLPQASAPVVPAAPYHGDPAPSGPIRDPFAR